jgi:hypothetical protein
LPTQQICQTWIPFFIYTWLIYLPKQWFLRVVPSCKRLEYANIFFLYSLQTWLSWFRPENFLHFFHFKFFDLGTRLLIMFLLLNEILYVYVCRTSIYQIVSRSCRKLYYTFLWRIEFCKEVPFKFVSVLALLFIHLGQHIYTFLYVQIRLVVVTLFHDYSCWKRLIRVVVDRSYPFKFHVEVSCWLEFASFRINMSRQLFYLNSLPWLWSKKCWLLDFTCQRLSRLFWITRLRLMNRQLFFNLFLRREMMLARSLTYYWHVVICTCLKTTRNRHF